MNLANAAPARELQDLAGRETKITSPIFLHEISKLQILREWGDHIDSRELYLLNKCIDWVESFPSKEGSNGVQINPAIHPYINQAIAKREVTLAVAPLSAPGGNHEPINQILKGAAKRFLEQFPAVKKSHPCQFLILPNLPGEKLSMAMDPGTDTRTRLLEMGVLVGEYYQTDTIKSQAFHPPVSIVVLRHFESNDWEFVKQNQGLAKIYRDRFGSPSKKQMKEPPPTPAPAKTVAEKVQSHHDPVIAPQKPRLTIHRTLDAIARLRTPWNQLAGADATLFQSFDWNHLWFDKCIDDINHILVFTLEVKGRVKAILPGYIDGRVIRLAGDDACGYQDVIAAGHEDATELIKLVLSWLSEEMPKHSLSFINCHSDGYIQHVIERHKIPCKDVTIDSRFHTNIHTAEIGGGFKGYTDQVTVTKCTQLEDALERLTNDEKEFSFQVKRSHEVDADSCELAINFLVSNTKWASPLPPEVSIEFLQALAANGDSGLQIGYLNVEEQLIAVEIGFAKNGVYYSWLSGSDKAYKSYDPVRCLMACRLDELAANDGVNIFDSQTGKETPQVCYPTGDFYVVNSHRLFPLKNRISWIAEKARKLYLPAKEDSK